jgi:hypothetical protein
MNNYVGELVKSYFHVLDGSITYNGRAVNVYNVSVSADENFHHIVLRPESESDSSNKRSFVTNPVIIADIVTVHEGGIDASVVEYIDDQMRDIIFTTRNTTAMNPVSGMQILNVKAENSSYLDGFDGVRYEYRKITRFSNRILQTT